MRLLKPSGPSLALVGLVGVVAVLGFRQWRTGNVGPVQRGHDVAASHGCFACHGPGGLTGQPDAGPGIGSVPSFSADDVRAYAQNEGEIREWILDVADHDEIKMVRRHGAGHMNPFARSLCMALRS